MTIAIVVSIILFFIAVIAVSKTYEYRETLEGMAQLCRLLSLGKEDLKKESIGDQIYICLLNFFTTKRLERRRLEDIEEDLPTFKEYKNWQAERPDLKTWREYKEWKALEEKRTDGGGDA